MTIDSAQLDHEKKTHPTDSTSPKHIHTSEPGGPDNATTNTVATTHGYHHDQAAYIRRVRRIAGQVRGIERMIDEDTYCIDILTQVAATTKALQSLGLALLQDHVEHCVTTAAAEGDPAVLTVKTEEVTQAIARFLRT